MEETCLRRLPYTRAPPLYQISSWLSQRLQSAANQPLQHNRRPKSNRRKHQEEAAVLPNAQKSRIEVQTEVNRRLFEYKYRDVFFRDVEEEETRRVTGVVWDSAGGQEGWAVTSVVVVDENGDGDADMVDGAEENYMINTKFGTQCVKVWNEQYDIDEPTWFS